VKRRERKRKEKSILVNLSTLTERERNEHGEH